MKKRLMALLLTLAMVVTFMPAMAMTAFAVEKTIEIKVFTKVAKSQYGDDHYIYAGNFSVNVDDKKTLNSYNDTINADVKKISGLQRTTADDQKGFYTSYSGDKVSFRNALDGAEQIKNLRFPTADNQGNPYAIVIADQKSNYTPVIWHIRCGQECKEHPGEGEKVIHKLADLKIDGSLKAQLNKNNYIGVSKMITMVEDGKNAKLKDYVPKPYTSDFVKVMNESGYEVSWVNFDLNNRGRYVPDSVKVETTYDLNMEITEQLEPHVRFVEKYYKIVFHENNGNSPERTATQAVTANNPENLKTVSELGFAKTDYHFVKWTKNEDGTGDSCLDGVTAPSGKDTCTTINMHAQWVANVHTVTLNPNGGTVNPTSVNVSYDQTYGPLPIPEKTGFNFAGWYYGDQMVTAETNCLVDADHELVAHWTPVEPGPQPTPVENFYNVKFDPDNGDAVKTESVKEGTPVAQPTKPSKRNFVFEGWVDASGKVWNFADAVNSDMTLTAKWKPIVKEYLMIEAKDSGKNITTYWNDLSKADYYVLYGNQCGKKAKKLVKTTKNTYTVKKIAGKAPKAHKTYKFYVYAYDKNGKLIDKSLVIHFIKNKTKGKMANVTSITPTIPEVTLKVGEKVKVGAKLKVYKNMKHLDSSHGAQLRFKTDTYGVAKVDKKGNVTALEEGTARIFIQDAGGKYVATVVTVTK